jgi:hypothetical protein
MAPRASPRIFVCKKDKGSNLQSFSWPSSERCNLDEMHACNWRTTQQVGRVGRSPSKKNASWARHTNQEEELDLKHLVFLDRCWCRPVLMTSTFLFLHQNPTQPLRCNCLLLQAECLPLSPTERKCIMSSLAFCMNCLF